MTFPFVRYIVTVPEEWFRTAPGAGMSPCKHLVHWPQPKVFTDAQFFDHKAPAMFVTLASMGKLILIRETQQSPTSSWTYELLLGHASV